MTARGQHPTRRREARLLERAECLRRVEGISLREAARRLRADRHRVGQAARDEITPAVMLAEIRAEAPDVRKALHDVRKAVRT